MHPDTVRLWTALESRALNLLKEKAGKARGLRGVQLGVYPSFSASRIWTLHETHSSDGPSTWEAQQILWQRDQDWERLETLLEDPKGRLRLRYKPEEMLVPTLVQHTAPLEREWIEGWLERLPDLPMAMAFNAMAGVDGTSYTLKLSNFQHALELRWWSHLPEAWREFHAVTRELLEHLGDDDEA